MVYVIDLKSIWGDGRKHTVEKDGRVPYEGVVHALANIMMFKLVFDWIEWETYHNRMCTFFLARVSFYKWDFRWIGIKLVRAIERLSTRLMDHRVMLITQWLIVGKVC